MPVPSAAVPSQCASGFLQVGGVSLQVIAEQRAGAPVDPGYVA